MRNGYYISRIGLIDASGIDLIDFINRMSTNDFRKFPENEFRKTVLTTDKGRIVDFINLLNFPDKKIIITTDGFEERVISHLSKYIIVDDVILKKAESVFYRILVTGDETDKYAILIAGFELENNKVYMPGENEFIYKDDFGIGSLNIICEEKNLTKYKERLSELYVLSEDEYESGRISAGLPEGVNEFNVNINPMECGLDRYISFVKGCYIGQEVIARLDSQGKRPKQMVIIKSENALEPDDKIFSDGKETGFVSSSVIYENENSALGFIKSVNLDFEKDYYVRKNNEDFKINISKIN